MVQDATVLMVGSDESEVERDAVRDQVLVEVQARGVASLAELNRLFTAWVEGVYHQRPHSETGEVPLERFLRSGPPTIPGPRRCGRRSYGRSGAR